MATISGNGFANGATVVNALDANGVPVRSSSSVTVNTSNATVSGSNTFYAVNMGDGNDTLVGENMAWRYDGSPTVAFGNIDMGSGNDSVSLFRSGFTDIDMGSGNDTLVLEYASGRNVSMGGGDDYVRLGGNPDQTISDAELAQKAAANNTLNINGGAGVDTLNLQGEWTVTLTSNVTIDMNGNGIFDAGDVVTNVYSNSDVKNIIGYPTVLSGTVSFGTVTLANNTTIANRAVFSNFEVINAVCFTSGTLIETDKGLVTVETLNEGDMVKTRNGFQPLRWIGKRKLDAIDLRGNPKLLPVRVPAGAFGGGLPSRDVSFSPQHRVLIRSSIAERMFGVAEVLVPVKQLVGFNGIDIDGEVREVTYFHLMFEDHQIVTVEGIEAESLYPGRQAMSFLSQDQLMELRQIFAGFDAMCEADSFSTGIPFLKGRETRSLAARHAKNGRPLYS